MRRDVSKRREINALSSMDMSHSPRSITSMHAFFSHLSSSYIHNMEDVDGEILNGWRGPFNCAYLKLMSYSCCPSSLICCQFAGGTKPLLVRTLQILQPCQIILRFKLASERSKRNNYVNRLTNVQIMNEPLCAC